MNKILIIGQAPPAVKQQYPYDTTMLYDWLGECGVSKEAAQDIFIFESMTDKFPGFTSNGGHNTPSEKEMDKHMVDVLIPLLKEHKKVLLMGNISQDYFNRNVQFVNNECGKLNVCFLIHPSKRNYSLYQKNKTAIINKLKQFLL